MREATSPEMSSAADRALAGAQQLLPHAEQQRDRARERREQVREERRQAREAEKEAEAKAREEANKLARARQAAERFVAEVEKALRPPLGTVSSVMKIYNNPAPRFMRGHHEARPDRQPPRPLSPDRSQTFHFSVTHCSKSDPRIAKAISGRKCKGTAKSHARYIEREGAAEVIPSRDDSFSREVGSPGSSGKAEQAYIERDGAAEWVTQGREIASFGNISEVYEERLAFWEKVEACERQPRQHLVRIDRSADPALWSQVERSVENGMPVPDCLARCLDDTSIVQKKLDGPAVLDLVAFLRSMGMDGRLDGDEPEQPIRISPARGGRIQTRIVAELPYEMTPAQRLATAKDYCRQFDDLGLPYWAVIHAPDQRNDHRNFHIHIALSERPAKRIPHPITGEMIWDFEYQTIERDQHRNLKKQRPHAQARNRDVHQRNWVRKQRVLWCAMLNQHLMQGGISKRYDPRTYKEMGIEQEARTRLPPSIYAMEKKGLATKLGLAWAKADWDAVSTGSRGRRLASTVFVEDKLSSLRAKEREIAGISGGGQQPQGLALISDVRSALLQLAALYADLRAHRTAAERLISRIKLIAPEKRNAEENAIIETALRVQREHFSRTSEMVDALDLPIADGFEQLERIAREIHDSHSAQSAIEPPLVSGGTWRAAVKPEHHRPALPHAGPTEIQTHHVRLSEGGEAGGQSQSGASQGTAETLQNRIANSRVEDQKPTTIETIVPLPTIDMLQSPRSSAPATFHGDEEGVRQASESRVSQSTSGGSVPATRGGVTAGLSARGQAGGGTGGPASPSSKAPTIELSETLPPVVEGRYLPRVAGDRPAAPRAAAPSPAPRKNGQELRPGVPPVEDKAETAQNPPARTAPKRLPHAKHDQSGAELTLRNKTPVDEADRPVTVEIAPCRPQTPSTSIEEELRFARQLAAEAEIESEKRTKPGEGSIVPSPETADEKQRRDNDLRRRAIMAHRQRNGNGRG